MSDLDYDALRKVAEATITPKTCDVHERMGALLRCQECTERANAGHALRTMLDTPTVLRLLDLAQRAEAAEAAVERVRRVSEYWDLSEFPHEATATAMRSELIAALDAKADQ